jgi:hypothetical protein
MPLRIAFDMDGVLADFERAFREVEVRLFGDEIPTPPYEPPEVRAVEEAKQRESSPDPDGPAPKPASDPVPRRRKLDQVWETIAAVPDFWTTLEPIDRGAVRRIKEMAIRHGWEVFFITQRPKTAGESVQRQTQRWLVSQGFDWPSVIALPGSRGKAAAALSLDYLVDDSPKNCVDVISDSRSRALLIAPEPDERTAASARRLGIGVARSISECLEILEHATEVRTQPGLFDKLARMVGWK